jgi:uncharacterized protein YjbI with pentapeptide repeats
MARKKATPGPTSPLQGKRFWLDPKLRLRGPGGYRRWVEGRGGVLVPDVDDRLDYLVLAEMRRAAVGKSQAERKAAKLSGAKITTLYEDELPALLMPSREEALAVLAGGAANSNKWDAMLPPYGSPCGLQIDLSGADLSGLELTNFDLRNCNLDGIRLKGTNLDESALDHPKNVDFRTIKLAAEFYIGAPEHCHFGGMELGDIGVREPVRCDFSDASFAGDNLGGWETTDIIAERANFHQAFLAGAKLAHARLAGAVFTRAALSSAVFDRADLRESNFEDANLRRASFRNADLRRAQFRNANLGEANFTGASITGTDFTGANLHNAKGLSAALLARTHPGTRLLQLEAALMDAADWQLDFALGLSPRGRAEVQLHLRGEDLSQVVQKESLQSFSGAPNLVAALRDLATENPGAVPLLHTIRLTPEALAKQLGPLTLLALGEAFGQPPMTPEQAVAARRTAEQRAARSRKDTLAALRLGARGVKRWNRLDRLERRAQGDLKGIDLARCQLAGVNLRDVNCDAANFEGANLSQAELFSTNFRKANLKGADLSKASAYHARMREANLEGASLRGGQFSYGSFHKANLRSADLRGATLERTNLCGTDLTGAAVTDAQFDRAEYDAQTQFPAGFSPQAAQMRFRTPRPKSVGS